MNLRRDIEGLRALAVIPVVLFHFQSSWVSGGFVGVDVFFVISGYLITRTILDDIETGQFSIARFYWKRARRIIPAFVFMALLTCAACAFILLPDDLVGFSQSLMASAAFVANIYFWKTANYFDVSASLKPMLHMWSLSVEEQYYIFAPIGLYLVYKYLRAAWVAMILPILIVSLLFSIFGTEYAPTVSFYMMPTRAWEILIGAMLASHRMPPCLNLTNDLVAATGLLLILGSALLLTEADPFPGYLALLPCLGAAAIIYAGEQPQTSLVGRIIGWRPVTFVGRISYSLYLIHWPIISIFRYRSMRDPTLAETGLLIVLSIILAWFSWQFVEEPFRQNNKWSQPNAIFSISAVSLALVALVGLTGIATSGLPARFPGFKLTQIEVGDWKQQTCFVVSTGTLASWTEKDCWRTSGFSTSVFLWGDSFAAQYAQSMPENGSYLKANVQQYTYAGCPPILSYYSYARPSCADFNRRAIDILKGGGYEYVVLSARWEDYERRGFDGIQSTIDELTKIGLKVVVIGQSPEFAADIRKLDYFLGSHVEKLKTAPLAIDENINTRLMTFTNGATFIDPLPFLCFGGQCQYKINEDFRYTDYGHFSKQGATFAIRSYWPIFGERIAYKAPVERKL
ncbi:acyltransferase [Rhizobium sp. B230/85]|uniref:acyltransferase family protein n=1 Tax=unclassified Rhizobium TaxID=2613769 RepID=UPI001ADCAB8C|nr:MULTISPECIES: acyltransferase family protein [unclassified Rhizobium]MBO9136782.1 acyltransferase [Rhizobium sp. B209b/85]QXZ99070.1 acyltransferase [Rhizobium sp. B230/85]